MIHTGPEVRDAASPPEVVHGELHGVGRSVALSGAWLFAVGLVTGIWAAAALTGIVTLRNPHLALAAHLNALLGGLWLVSVAATAPYLGPDARAIRRLARWIAVPSWANWLVTLFASVLGVTGLQFTQDLSNNAIAGLLQATVVLPSFVGAFLWIRAFYRCPAR